MSDDNQIYAFEYLKIKAFEAHFEGNGILVNHLCALGLDNLNTIISSNPSAIKIFGIRWILVLSLYWLLDAGVIDRIDNVLSKFKIANTTDSKFLNIYKLIFNQVKYPFGIPDVKSVDKLISQNNLWVDQVFEEEDKLLVELLVGLTWYSDDLKSKYLEVLIILEDNISEFSMNSKLLKDRYVFQTAKTYGFSKALNNSESTFKISDELTELAKLWNYYVNLELESIETELSEVNVDNEFFDIKTNLYNDIHHFTRMSRTYFGEGKIKQSSFGDPQLTWLSRRRLHLASNPSSIFKQIRDSEINRMQNALWSEATDKSKASMRMHCLRLIMLSELNALKDWNYSEWLNAVRFKLKAFCELYKQSTIDKKHIAFYAVKIVECGSISNGFEKDDKFLKRAVKTLDFVDYDNEKYVSDLLELPRIVWPSVLQVVSEFSDALPEEVLPKLAKWCVDYSAIESLKPYRDIFKSLYFWANVIPFCNDKVNITNILYPLVKILASNTKHWYSVDLIALIGEYLKNSSLENAGKIGRIMFSQDTSADSGLNEIRWDLFYNVILNRSELTDIFLDSLKKTATSPILKHYLNYATGYDIHKRIDDPELRSQIRNEIFKVVDEIVKRDITKEFPIGCRNFHLIPSLIWPDDDMELLDKILTGIYSNNS